MDDFERRRELRRQKREEMRLEAERIAYQRNDDDEEEAARERRRRARQERLRQKQEEDSLGQVTTDQVEVNAQNSVSNEEVKTTSSHTPLEGDDEAAFQERLARREERRQKRLQEALERQKELDPTITDGGMSLLSRRATNSTADTESTEKEEKRESRQERYELDETGSKSYQKNDWRETEAQKKEGKEKEEEEEEKPKPGSMEDNQVEVSVGEKPAEPQEEVVGMSLNNGQVSAEEPRGETGPESSDEVKRSAKVEEEEEEEEKERERAEAERVRLEAEERERIQAEQERKLAEEKARLEAEEKAAAQEREKREAEERKRREEEERKAAEERQRAQAEEAEKAKKEEQKRQQQLEEKRRERQEEKVNGEKVDAKLEGKWVNEKKAKEEKLPTAAPKKQVKDEKMKKDKEPKEEVKSFLDGKKGFTEVKSQNGEFLTHKLKPTENTFSRPGARASEVKEAEEAGKRLEELRRRRGETESEEFEKLKQKQQEAALELEELKKKREERRKVLEEEEQRRKQEEAERKVREEEEKRRLKEEIGRRRAEAAEKRQKMPEDASSDDKKPFKCFTPKGSSLKIEERAEFLNKSVQKSSGIKSTHQAAVVSKIDSRLEQYTSAIEGTKSAKPTKPAASDLPVPAEGVRNIKSMWEKGNVFSSPSASGTPNKETAGLKVGVSSRINEWLTKTPDGHKSPAPKPSDLRPGDVSGKRNLWEKQSVDKVTSPTKV